MRDIPSCFGAHTLVQSLRQHNDFSVVQVVVFALQLTLLSSSSNAAASSLAFTALSGNRALDATALADEANDVVVDDDAVDESPVADAADADAAADETAAATKSRPISDIDNVRERPRPRRLGDDAASLVDAATPAAASAVETPLVDDEAGDMGAIVCESMAAIERLLRALADALAASIHASRPANQNWRKQF